MADFPRAGDSPAEAMAVLGDGRVVVAGRDRLFTGAAMQARIARLLPDGSPDPGFDGDGFVTIPLRPSDDVDLQVLGDEDLVVTGSTVGPMGDRDLFLARVDGAGEDLPLFSIADTTVAEGEPGYFEIDVVLSAPVSRPTSVGVRTVAGTAGIYDFTPFDSSVPFAAGQTRARVQIPIRDTRRWSLRSASRWFSGIPRAPGSPAGRPPFASLTRTPSRR